MNFKIKISLFVIVIIAISLTVANKVLIDKKKYYNIKEKAQFNVASEVLLGKNITDKLGGVLINHPDGFEILVDANDNGVSKVIVMDSWEPHITNILKQVVKPGGKVLCLGGHIGYHMLMESKLVGPEGRVFVFEPNPQALKFLKANLFLNNIQNVTLFEKAAYSSNTELAFASHTSGNNTGGSHVITEQAKLNDGAKEIKVEAVTIDSIDEIQSIDVIQMDIEGAEPHAIKGAEKLIANSPNLILIQEWNIDFMDSKLASEYISDLESKGFEFAIITKESLSKRTVAQMLEPGHFDVLVARNIDAIIKNFKPAL